MSSHAAHVPWFKRPWLGVLSRSAAAIFGGYAMASISSVLLAQLVSAPSQGVLTGMMVGILVCACAALWAFAASSASRAWLGIVAPSVLMLGLSWLIGRGAA